jgi:hypothetical protein
MPILCQRLPLPSESCCSPTAGGEGVRLTPQLEGSSPFIYEQLECLRGAGAGAAAGRQARPGLPHALAKLDR